MPAFRFEAATAAGRIERGVIDADSPKLARGVLRERGLTPISVAPVENAAGNAATSLGLGARLRDADLALATRQLASLLSAKLPLERALSAVVEQAERAVVRERFAALVADASPRLVASR
jgi:general secretion pathway protein F